MSLETPRHRVEGLGAAHSGVTHFWRQRVSAAALVPLTIWFAVSALGLVGTSQADMAFFLAKPLNAILMAAFVMISVYHMALGLQVVIDDYIYVAWQKLTLMLLMRAFSLAVVATCLYFLIRIAG
ncbi:MAG: succinate dehydrogenase, hydrophobic membrane anchor protein [Alphaproteobacteria bacterium]|nr:succinate dehydrogenase, hydrophobic membrane anchor protein [Alphaproteobacteria bacterium]MBV9420279.1 succinate dehydrogenase, hydrophobic membrane anchor protein [Alphaproteobacteria bacterium]MBV9542114.1 succinate dehydrogenase, hydrophobic membrane anchor protein [Alphaproteobacteria bacterium]